MVVFSSQRLLIRRLELKDAPGYIAMHSDPEVLKYTGSETWNAEEALSDLKRMIRLYDKPENDFKVWAVAMRSDDALIGTCALIGDRMKPEIGYRFIKDYWGRGYGGELVASLLKYIVTETQATSVRALIMPANEASIRIVEHNGFELLREFYNDEIKALDREYQFKVNRLPH